MRPFRMEPSHKRFVESGSKDFGMTVSSAQRSSRRFARGESECRLAEDMNQRLIPMSVQLTDATPSMARVERRDLGDMLITDWTCPPLEAVRSRRADLDDGDRVVLLTAHAGLQRFLLGDREIALKPGATLLLSARMTPKLRLTIAGPMRKRSIAFPAVSLEACGSDGFVPESRILDESRPLMKLIRAYVDAIWPRLGEMNAAEVEVTRSSLLHLIAGALRPEPSTLGGEAFLPALRVQLEQWIIDNLQLGRVLVEEIAHANSVSTRTVHRAFALTGDTVGSIIRTHRLRNARRDVVSTRLPMSAIAHKWGYYDASHFGREFRRAFSASPGDYRNEFGLRLPADQGALATAG